MKRALLRWMNGSKMIIHIMISLSKVENFRTLKLKNLEVCSQNFNCFVDFESGSIQSTSLELFFLS